MSLSRIAKCWFTESDNQTHDVAKVLAALTVLTGLGLTLYSVLWRGDHFDMTSFGTGCALLFGGIGAALALKKETPIEPSGPQDSLPPG